MFKKTANRRNFRKKKASDEESEGEEKNNKGRPTPLISTNMNSLNSDVTDNKTEVLATTSSSASLLSFSHVDDDEDEVPAFQIKKSSHSRRLEKFRKRIERDRLKGIKDDDEGNESSRNHSRDNSPIKWSPGEKRLSPERSEKTKSSINLPNVDASNVDLLDDEDDEQLNRFSSSGRSVVGAFKGVFEEGAIPDAEMVYRARKQRQRAREGEVIPLVDDTQRYTKGNSRLVREDDDDHSDDGEEGGRFYSKDLLHRDEEERRKTEAEFLAVEQGESDKESDDELERWEREQIKKGVSVQQISSYQQEQLNGQFFLHQKSFPLQTGVEYDHNLYKLFNEKQQKHIIDLESSEPEPMDLEVDQDSNEKLSSVLPKIGGGPAPSSLSIITVQDIVSKMNTRLTESDQMRRSRFLEKEKLGEHLSENETTITKMEDDGPKAKQRYFLFQELGAYVRDLLDCFNEKLPEITAVEERMIKLLKARNDFFVGRRRQDVKDQFEQCSALASARQLQQDPDTMIRVAEREARRNRRRQAREKTVKGIGHHDAMSSDDEETPSRIATFSEEKEKIVSDADLIFLDTMEEFCSIKAIISRFFDWLATDQSSFDDAYIGLCIPKLISPIVRVDIIGWNPLDNDCPSLEKTVWYKELVSYGGYLSTTEQEHSALVGLLPAVVEKVIIPKISELVETVWDPVSSSQSRRLSSFLKEFIDIYPTFKSDSKQSQTLLSLLHKRIKETLDEDLFMPIYGKDAIENPSTGAKLFLDRQYWLSVKVLRNALLFEGILSTEVIQEFVIDGILNRQIVLGLQCSVFREPTILVKSRAVIDSLPLAWLTKNYSSPEKFLHLEPLCKALCRIAEDIHNCDSPGSRDTVKDVYKMLQKLGARNHANRLLDRTGIRL